MSALGFETVCLNLTVVVNLVMVARSDEASTSRES